jgi:hypothetical protein
MKTKLLVILILTIILITFSSCGITQADYDKALAEKLTAEQITAERDITISELQAKLDNAIPTYFKNRTAIENWMKTIHNLGVSKTNEQWLQYALYYQKKALEFGHIISVSYTLGDDSMSVTCDIVTEDGWIYYFDPDELELKDTRIRVDMVEASELEATYASFQ